jgi:hypothetical protein
MTFKERYSKDPKAWFAGAFITVFLILVAIASPEYWYWCLIAFGVYVGIFWAFRNNA